MVLDFRYGVWAPPHAVWDIVTEYLGFIAGVNQYEDECWNLCLRIEKSIPTEIADRIFKRAPSIMERVHRSKMFWELWEIQELRLKGHVF